jgi:hypothetical protein
LVYEYSWAKVLMISGYVPPGINIRWRHLFFKEEWLGFGKKQI